VKYGIVSLDPIHPLPTTFPPFSPFQIILTSMQDLYGPTGHLSSPAMSKFLSLIPAFSTTGLDLSHYRLVAGFLDLPSPSTFDNLPTLTQVPTPAEIILDIRVTSTSPALLTSLATLVHNIEQQERSLRSTDETSSTLTYMAFASLDNETGLRILGRWKTREDMESFVRRKDVVGFWMTGKEWIKGMEQRVYVGNGKGWLHRGVGSGFAGDGVKGAKM
jgi:hypothetical protein